MAGVPKGDIGYWLNERLVREDHAALSNYPLDVRRARQAAAEGARLWADFGGVDTTPPPGGPTSTLDGAGDRGCSDLATHAEAPAFDEAAGGPAGQNARAGRQRPRLRRAAEGDSAQRAV